MASTLAMLLGTLQEEVLAGKYTSDEIDILYECVSSARDSPVADAVTEKKLLKYLFLGWWIYHLKGDPREK